jgi:hypothetical protein
MFHPHRITSARGPSCWPRCWLPSPPTSRRKRYDKPPLTGRAPSEVPRIPPPDPRAAQVPASFSAAVVASGFIYPSSIEFDDRGAMCVAEAGFNYGDCYLPLPARGAFPPPDVFQVPGEKRAGATASRVDAGVVGGPEA